MAGYRLAAAAALGVLAVGPALAGEAKWGPHIDFEGKVGTERRLGEADLFLPVAQDDNDLLFTSLRTRMDDQSSREGNFGLGLRHMLESGWNLGGYGYFDRRRSELDNFFNQVTVGAEALSLDWDFRVNGYIPVGRRKYDEDRFNTAEISGTSVIFRGGEERSLGGFDAEIGWRVPLFAPDAGQQLRLYGGGYRFTADNVPDVTGPRGRAEVVFDEVPGLGGGSRLSVGAEIQHDDPRGTQGFGSIRLRIPLQAEAPNRLTPMERRMTDPIVRDIDVVAQAGTFGAAETATLASSGTLTVVNSASTTTAAALNQALSDAATAAGPPGSPSTVILAGSFNTTARIDVQANQTVMAGNVAVRSASGRTATVYTPATINGPANTGIGAVFLNDGATLTGLTITASSAGGWAGSTIFAQGRSNVVIRNNTIIQTGGNNGAYALDVRNSPGSIVEGNVITTTVTGGGSTGIYASAATTLSLSNNTISTSGPAGKFALVGSGVTSFTAGSTGNVAVGGICDGVPGATIFTNINCP